MIGTSVGISLYPSDGETSDDLVRAAIPRSIAPRKRAVARSVSSRRSWTRASRSGACWSGDLRQALAAEALKVHYQPLADCHGGGIVGCEALVRWNHPERGYISPVQFIPLAEECGLIMQLGAWVMRRACTDAVGCRTTNSSPSIYRQRSSVTLTSQRRSSACSRRPDWRPAVWSSK